MKLIIFLTLCFSSFANDSIFRIRPFFIIGKDNTLVVKMMTHKKQKLQAEVVLYRPASKTTSWSKKIKTKKNKISTTELIDYKCGSTAIASIYRKKIKIYELKYQFPECGQSQVLRFIHISDTQQDKYNTHARFIPLIKQIANERRVHFIINTGDIVHEGDKNKDWNRFFNVFNYYSHVAPFVAVVGNHDNREDDHVRGIPEKFYEYFRWKKAPKGGALSYEWENFFLLSFNSDISKMPGDSSDDQWDFIKKQFKYVKKRDKFVVMATHHPPISSNRRSKSTKETIDFLDDLKFKRRKHIRLFLSGHTHMYERSEKEGTNYVVAGAAGGRIGKKERGNKYRQILTKDRTLSLYEIDSEFIYMRTYDIDGNIIEEERFDTKGPIVKRDLWDKLKDLF